MSGDYVVARSGRVESAPGQEPWVSARPRPFLEEYTNRYLLSVVPLSASAQDASLALKEANVVALRKEHWIVGTTDPKLPLVVEPGIGAADKRLSRLVGIHDAGRAFSEEEVRIGHLKVGPATRLALDGAEVTLSRRFLRRVLEPELSRWREAERNGNPDERAQARHNIWRLLRLLPKRGEVRPVYVTIQTRMGQLKGHAIVRDKVTGPDGNEVDILFPEDALKTEVKLTLPEVFVAVTKVKAARLRLDVQTLTMHGSGSFFADIAPKLVTEYVNYIIDKLRDGRYYELLTELVDSSGPERLRKLRGWPLLDFVARGGNPRWFAWMVRAAGRALLGEIVADADRLRIPVLGCERRYLYTDVRTGIPVSRGEYKLVGDWGIIVNAVDYLTADPSFASIHDLNAWVERGGDLDSLKPGIAKTLGGMDQDDMVIVLGPFISRSPTMVGEWWFFPKMADRDPRFKDLDPSLLPTQGPAIFDIELTPAAQEHGRSKAALLKAGQVIAANGSVVGRTALALRYAVAAGMMPEAMPLGMEGIIDAASKSLMDCSPIQEWATNLIKKVAAEGEIPACMAEEVARSAQVDIDDLKIADGHWLDDLVAHMEGEIIRAEEAVEEAAAKAMPPLKLFEEFEPLDHGAAEFRKVHYNLWKEARARFLPEGEDDTDDPEIWEQMRTFVDEGCADFLWSCPDPVGIVGATVRRIYLQRAMSLAPGDVSDSILFQESVRPFLYEALERVGLLGQPQHDPDGFYELVWREPDPQALRWVVPVYGVWTRFAPPNPTKAEKKAAKETDFSSWLLGLVVEVEMEQGRDHRGTWYRPVFYVDGERIGSGPRGHLMPEEHPTWAVEGVIQDDGAAVLFLKKWNVGDPLPVVEEDEEVEDL